MWLLKACASLPRSAKVEFFRFDHPTLAIFPKFPSNWALLEPTHRFKSQDCGGSKHALAYLMLKLALLCFVLDPGTPRSLTHRSKSKKSDF